MYIKNLVRTIIVDRSGQVLLLQRAKNDDQRPGEWDFPGGGVDDGETLPTAAIRETKEEANLVLQENHIRLVYAVTGPTSIDPDMSVNRLIYASAFPEGQSIKLSHEHEEFTWLAVEDALRAFTHPVYIAALRYASDNGLLEF